MVDKKPLRTKGKISFSRYFQELQEGDSVAIVREHSIDAKFPSSLQGRTGKVEGKRGKSYLVRVLKKQYIIEPVHLKKIKTMEKND